jgi:hypothetical protein
MTTTAARIIETDSETALYRHYDGETSPQPCYIELDLREGTLLADYNSEIGTGIPFSVYHGFERRYGIPVLTGTAADELMRELAPLAERILADWESDFDGNNRVAVLGEDAQAAEAELEELLRERETGPDELVAEWGIDGAVNGAEAEEYDITADTTDERLAEIEDEILTGLAEISESGTAVCPELHGYLRQLRDEQADGED